MSGNTLALVILVVFCLIVAASGAFAVTWWFWRKHRASCLHTRRKNDDGPKLTFHTLDDADELNAFPYDIDAESEDIASLGNESDDGQV